jgi:predicted phosphatase
MDFSICGGFELARFARYEAWAKTGKDACEACSHASWNAAAKGGSMYGACHVRGFFVNICIHSHPYDRATDTACTKEPEIETCAPTQSSLSCLLCFASQFDKDTFFL